MNTLIDIINTRRSRLESEINELQQKKFSSFDELAERDAVISSKVSQLKRVAFANLPYQNGYSICPECFILHNIKVQTYSTGHGDDEVDVFKCPECKLLIDAQVS